MEELLQQLTAAGVSPKDAAKAIKAAYKLSPVDGAKKLQKLGATYPVAFRALSQPFVEAKDAEHAAAGGSGMPAWAWAVLGLALIAASYVLTKRSYSAAVQENADKFLLFKGLFFGGVGCLIGAVYKWLRA